MLRVRYAHERGKSHPAIHWLRGYHSFSFADYYSPQHIHFSHLRVINEDIIAPQHGFDMHPHQDMEILTYILSGRIEHRDSMGNHTQLHAGEFQIMSAGSGVHHAEINPNSEHDVHLYQIWILPKSKGIAPRYEQGRFADKEGATLILSPEAKDGAFYIHQDMSLWRWQLSLEQSAVKTIPLLPTRRYWLQLVKGQLRVNNVLLNTSDGLAITHENALQIELIQNSEFLLFDLV
ncbi:pirin family protein [Pasteurella multocida]|uniref:pirin family protein n=1 Tax=Pasteurella multocida TaxID=747 RepID=UPI0020252C2C|nr:pirin family protein [Pasteurella multocida]MDT8767909.1 pirin family protein [Pasteurella multocida]MDY0577995.1 pirin family protein [Pasteurella multocida]MEB3496844.1 pirin family protein [Pasteurella multocida]MEB3500395.1 pirin family protein [Pasteurella multocida]URJ87936.1 pirin family protein [Pasteurella multocida]